MVCDHPYSPLKGCPMRRVYRGTSLIRKRLLLGPYSRPVHRAQ